MRISLAILALSFPFLSLYAQPFDGAAEEIIEAGVFLNHLALCPATSGNLSVRIAQDRLLVTASGKHKGKLTQEDIVLIDLEGKVQGDTKKPSAETLIHTAIYAQIPETGAVIHTHSVNGIVLTRIISSEDLLITQGYEIHKAFPGITTHESRIEIPVFENSQDISAMKDEVTAYLQQHPSVYGFLIRGHGFYTWGRNMTEAKMRIEAFEHLFEAEIKVRTLSH